MKNTAYISIGSNIGDSLKHCKSAIGSLNDTGGLRIFAHSRYFYTKPVGYLDQPWFVNAAFAVKTDLPPFALLRRLQDVQRFHGRKKGGIRFGPRILDLDILFYNDIVSHNPALIIPHPRITERRFVLEPLCDIAPALIYPGLGVSVKHLLDQLPSDAEGCRPIESGIELPDTGVPA